MAAQYKSMVKRMHHGMAAQAGLVGAVLASKGFIGTESVLEHTYGGLASTILGDAREADFTKLTNGLRDEWILKTIGIKRHACLIMLHSTIDAMIALRQEGVLSEQIERIRIGVSESVARRTAWKMEPPGKTLSAQMNLRFATAVALLDGAAYVDQFSADSLSRPQIWDLMERIDVVHDPRVDDLGRDRRFVTHVDIDFTDAPHRRIVTKPPQDVPFEADAVKSKFRSLVAPLIPSDRAQAIEQYVLHAAAESSSRELRELLGMPAEPALADVK